MNDVLTAQTRRTVNRPPVVFGPSPMTSLLDTPVRFDLAESTSPSLGVDEIGGWAELEGLRLGYGTVQGSRSLRARIAEDHGVETEQVILTSGSAGAMLLIALDRCHGSTVLITPCYPPALLGPDGLGSPVDRVRLRFEDGYRMQTDEIAESLTPQTTLVSLASPQNPSGVRFTTQELDELLSLMAERSPQAFLLIDETYRASTYGVNPVPSSAAPLDPRVVTCSSLSKAHGAPALRIGWLVATDPSLMQRLHAAKFVGAVASPGIDEELADRLLARQEAVLRPRADFLGERLGQLTRWALEQPVDLLRPDGGALCCLRLPPNRFGDDEVAAFYAELGTREARVAPGSWFGEEDRVFRIGFGHLGLDDFTEALARLGDALAISGRE